MASAARRFRLKSDRAFFGAVATAATLLAIAALVPAALVAAASEGRPLAGIDMAATAQTLLTIAWLLRFRAAAHRAASPRNALTDPVDRAAIGVAMALVIVGGLAAMSGAARTGSLPLPCLALFAGFALAALMTRPHAEAHKRLMLLATLSLLAPVAARLAAVLGLGAPLPESVDGMLLADLFLIALAAYDLRGRGRLQPVTLWAGGLFLLAQPLQLALH